ncbi:MAG: response regulator transcription factor [Puniceicoccales bacterium]|jgi:DNA-binding response OmpR family regulator|nr:response regulator transcription factor [Puniceicoccales bacterium]
MGSGQKGKCILIIDEDRAFAAELAAHVNAIGFMALTAENASEAELAIRRNVPNFLFLNVNLPDRSGVDFLECLWRADRRIPTIFIANRYSQEDPVRALRIGDDFQKKPLPLRELLARMGAVLRRTEMAGGGRIAENLSLRDKPFSFCGAEVYPAELQVAFPDGSRERLGRLEFGLLAAFAENRGKILSRSELAHIVWGQRAGGRGRSMDQHIMHIRKIFRAKGCAAVGQLCAIRGIGYLYGPQAQENRLQAPRSGPSTGGNRLK